MIFNKYRTMVKHDKGKTIINTVNGSKTSAIRQIMKIEGCPLRSILKVEKTGEIV